MHRSLTPLHVGFPARLESELQQLENARGEKCCPGARVLAAANRKYQAWYGAAELAAEDVCKLSGHAACMSTT